MAPPRKDFSGQRFGRLTVIKFSRAYKPNGSKENYFYWICRCDCGTEKELEARNFSTKGGAKSCGCLSKELHSSKAWKEKNFKIGSGFSRVLTQYKQNAKNRGISWDLTDEQVKNLTSSPCYYTGLLPATIKTVKSGETYVYNGIDRVDNSKGYTIDNCVPCCTAINLMKLDMTEQRFIVLCTLVAERFKK
jgi:hypothetical protein